MLTVFVTMSCISQPWIVEVFDLWWPHKCKFITAKLETWPIAYNYIILMEYAISSNWCIYQVQNKNLGNYVGLLAVLVLINRVLSGPSWEWNTTTYLLIHKCCLPTWKLIKYMYRWFLGIHYHRFPAPTTKLKAVPKSHLYILYFVGNTCESGDI